MPSPQYDELAQTLRFWDFEPAEINTLAPRFTLEKRGKGDLLFRQGEPANCMYVIRKGVVLFTRLDAKGKDVELGALGPGAFFGERAIVTAHYVRTASAKIREAVEVYVLTREAALDLFAADPRAGVKLLRALCEALSTRIAYVDPDGHHLRPTLMQRQRTIVH